MATAAAIDFIFEPTEKVDRKSLLQGDLLRRTPALAEMIGQAHSYYATATDYSHFLVLTQSCDLVRRKGQCKSRYITICAVRPLALAVEREFRRFVEPVSGFPLPIGSAQNMVLARNFLERILNNTVDGIFFVPKGACETVEQHMCAFLPLSIALRTDHYDACLEAKVGQATEIFAAKIGSLTSGLFSRIATPDLSERYGTKAAGQFRDAFFDEQGVAAIAWLSPFQRRALGEAVKQQLTQKGEGELDDAEAEALLNSLPSPVEALASRVTEALVAKKILDDDPDAIRKARNFLMNDGQFSRMAKGI